MWIELDDDGAREYDAATQQYGRVTHCLLSLLSAAMYVELTTRLNRPSEVRVMIDWLENYERTTHRRYLP